MTEATDKPVTPADTSDRPRPGNSEVFLGVFIVANIAFLVAMNGFEFFKDLNWVLDTDTPTGKLVSRLALDLPGEDESHAGELYRISRRCAEVTGLNQSWCLFAPDVFDSGVFADLEFRWDDGLPGTPPQAGVRAPLLLKNPNDPGDLHSYLRTGYSRWRKFETNIVVHIRRDKDDSDETTVENWSKAISRKFRKQWDTMQAYLNWRSRKWQGENPDAPAPRQVILHSRAYWILPPDTEPWTWDGPYSVPVARLRSGFDYVEMFDPKTRGFLSRDQALASK